MVALDPTFGCTITRASFPAMTPAKLVEMGMDQIAAAEAVANAVEAKAIGVREKGLMALLRGQTRSIKTNITMEKFGDQQIAAPFILRNQRSEFNANYWSLESSAAAPTAGTDLPNHARRFKIKSGRPIAGFSTSLTKLERYFLPGMTLTVETWTGTVSKAASVQSFEIVAAGNDDVNGAGEPQAWVDVVPIEITLAGWTALTEEQRAEYSPTFGVVILGANSISEYEDYCHQQPVDMSRKMIVDWIQDTRSAFKVNDEYKAALEAILRGKVNPYQQKYNFLDIMEQRKAAEERENQIFFNSVFYGVPYAGQSVNDYRDVLPKVYDPEDSNCILGYKARAEGIFTKLALCGRVRDLAGAPLDLDQLFSWLYQLRMHRDVDGGASNMVIDCLTSFWNKNLIFDVMTKYYTARYGVGISKWYQRNQKIQHNDWVSFEYDIYDIPDAGCQLVVYHDDYFTHRSNQFNRNVGLDVDFAPRGNTLWFLDLTDIRIGEGGTSQVVRKHPDPTVLALYKCRMKHNSTEYILKNRRWTVMLDRPHRHLIVHNFSSECPTVTVRNCTVPNPAV
jgi:hypothetical protein